MKGLPDKQHLGLTRRAEQKLRRVRIAGERSCSLIERGLLPRAQVTMVSEPARSVGVMTMRNPGEWIHGKYQVERVLGSGGMGVVYATRRRNQSQAAVKVLHPRFAQDKSVRARFVEEGFLANKVGHPAVVSILEDDIDEGGNFYLVMELLDGVDLGQFVGPGRPPLRVAQALGIAEQLLSALAHAHQKGIVHCDIKPGNVMVLRDGRVKLLDFGIARALHAEGAEDDDDKDGVLGTDRYMSPEQGHGSFDAIDARSDIWAVGALLLELLSEQDPSEVPLWDQSYEDRAWSFARMGSDVPPHVVQIISKALQPQKSNRWVSAAEMRDAVCAAHLDLYGRTSLDELALLLGASEPDGDRTTSHDGPADSGVMPPAVDPTVISRPSQSRPSRPSGSRPSGALQSDSQSTPFLRESPVPASPAVHSAHEPAEQRRGGAPSALRFRWWMLAPLVLGVVGGALFLIRTGPEPSLGVEETTSDEVTLPSTVGTDVATSGAHRSLAPAPSSLSSGPPPTPVGSDASASESASSGPRPAQRPRDPTTTLPRAAPSRPRSSPGTSEASSATGGTKAGTTQPSHVESSTEQKRARCRGGLDADGLPDPFCVETERR